jgi:microcystin-dependent protein
MAGFCPSGTIVDYGGDTAPPGWVRCDGATYDAVTNPGLYLNLFTVVGTKYGGTGQASFKVPDCQGRVTVGLGSHADVSTLGNTEGNANANRSYKHTMSNNLSAGSAPTLTGTTTFATSLNKVTQTGFGTGGSSAVVLDQSTGVNTGTVGISAGGAPGGTIGLTSGATRPTNGPAAIVFNKVIKL